VRYVATVVADPRIPVPPFRTATDADAFHRALALHIAEVSRASGGPFSETLALCSVVAGARPALLAPAEGDDDAVTTPSVIVLGIAMTLAFPAPWTPVALVEAVRAVMAPPGRGWTRVSRSEISYESDPEFFAVRDHRGAWTASFRERGVTRIDAALADDWALVLYLMDHLGDRFPFPFGRSTHDAEKDPLVRQNAQAVASHYLDDRLPYLTRWSLTEEADGRIGD
jgi:hypothetical protein